MHSTAKTQRTIGKKTSRGFLSVELGLVLLVVAVLIVGAVLFFTDNMRKTSVSSNVQLIQAISGAAKSTYGARNDYANVTTTIAVRSHTIPTEMRDGSATTASNPFGASVTVAPATSGTGGANDVLNLIWGNVPADQCSDIVTSVASAMRRIEIAGTDVKTLDGTLNNANLTTQCESAGTSGNVSITFVIGRS